MIDVCTMDDGWVNEVYALVTRDNMERSEDVQIQIQSRNHFREKEKTSTLFNNSPQTLFDGYKALTCSCKLTIRMG
jgi:hypothetical protein